MTTKKATRPMNPGDGVTLASPSVFEDAPAFSPVDNVVEPGVVVGGTVVKLTPADRRKALRGAAASFIRFRNRG